MNYQHIIQQIREQDLRFMKPVSEMTGKEIIDEYILHGLKYLEPKDVIKTLIINKPENLMDEDDVEGYNNLPDTIKIYRGCDKSESEGGIYGVSWTLNPHIANWFANRNPNGIVMYGTIPKKRVKVYTNRRNEEEVLILGAPDSIFKIKHYDC